MGTEREEKVPSTVLEWVEQELKDADLRRDVEETLNRMRIEQDLARLRERRQVSQRQLAKILGVSQPAIAKLEAGQAKNLELRTIIRYATALGARVRVLIEEDARTARRNGARHLAVVPARKTAKAS